MMYLGAVRGEACHVTSSSQCPMVRQDLALRRRLDFERLASFRQVARSHFDVVLPEPAMLHCPPRAQ